MGGDGIPPPALTWALVGKMNAWQCLRPVRGAIGYRLVTNVPLPMGGGVRGRAYDGFNLGFFGRGR